MIARNPNNQPTELQVDDNGQLLIAPPGSGEGAPAERIPTLQTVSATGTITAGAKSVSFYNSGTANATVTGGTLPAAKSVSFAVSWPDTLAEINYNGTGTTLLIAEVR